MFRWETAWAVCLPFVKAGMILLIGHFLIVYLTKLIRRVLQRSRLDDSLVGFIAKIASALLHVLVILSALSSLGISTAGIIAALSAIAVGVGVALKDSLGNLAGGILLLVSPRFSTGDYIETNSNSGTVISVDLLHTTVRTPDHKQVSIPNGVLINNQIMNYSREPMRRVDLTIPVPYTVEIETAKAIIKQTAMRHASVLSEPEEAFVRVCSYGDSAVNIAVRCWCNAADYWTVYFDLTEQIRGALVAEKIDMPFNQLDVRIVKQECLE